MTMASNAISRGGSWLIEDATEPIFTPERLSDEHRLIRQTADELVVTEVLPRLDELEQKDWALARALVRRCGELGILGTDVPEVYGGVELDKASSIVVGEAVGRSASFATTFGAQTSLAVTQASANIEKLRAILAGDDAIVQLRQRIRESYQLKYDNGAAPLVDLLNATEQETAARSQQALHDMLCDTLVVDKWAFTDRPEWQERGLGTVTVVILVLFGLFIAGALAVGLAMVGLISSMKG